MDFIIYNYFNLMIVKV